MRRVHGWFVGAAAMLVAVSALAQDGEPELNQAPAPTAMVPAADLVADLELLERTLVTLHPGFDRYTPGTHLDASMARLRERFSGGGQLDQVYLGISEHLSLIRCDHTKAEYPAAIERYRESHPAHLPFTPIIRSGRVFVAEATPESGLQRGDEILEMDSQPMVRLLGVLRGLVPIDGYTEHARDDELESTLEYMGSALEQFTPILLGWSATREVLIRRGDEFLRLTIPCIDWSRYQAMAVGPSPADFVDAVRVTFPSAGAAVLWVGTFVNYRRPIDPEAVFGPIFADLATRGIEHLIVDLRSNGGGSDDAQVALLRRLIREPLGPDPAPLVRATGVPEDLRPFLDTWDRWLFDPPQDMFEPAGDLFAVREAAVAIEPAPDAFSGRITLLTSRGNASGVTILLSRLASQPHIATVGEPTGGSSTGPTASTLVFLKLPATGITVRVPVVRSRIANPTAVEGLGITPDVVVEPTADDVLSGRDAVLEAALARP